ncbi:SPOSA6832_02391 [Sporobolomyces salmonicolor]|uniref:SPOSA6832_02391-mRNA-1:cds n=1 Tax=Sporidiobolus salmonicolor TaxID=5005 RepID=A0A0D6EL81_SPOSA|nr:SPOSA6832_02391 [Sporobolomyces salmonicolor]
MTAPSSRGRLSAVTRLALVGAATQFALVAAAAAQLPFVAAAALPSGRAPAVQLSVNLSLSGAIKQEYSHIVVGGGTAGLALASRLSEDPSLSVLVLEAGINQEALPGVMVPGLAGSTFQSDVDWAFFTTPQENAQGRSVYWPRGKLLGGSSALNLLSWDSLLGYFKRSEKFIPPTGNNQNVTPVYDASVHGTSGPVEVSFPPYISEQFVGFYDGLLAMNVSVAEDMSDGRMHGVSYSQSTTSTGASDNQHRVTSQTAYIDPIILSRANLALMVGVQVEKVLWSSEKTKRGLVTATGVEFRQANSTTSSTFTVSASQEVILSAGSIQSPQILELSGVGNASFLESIGISSVVDLPGVGENLQDHPALVVIEKLKDGYQSLDAVSANASLAAADLAEWGLGQGILTQEISTLAYLNSQTLLSHTDHTEALMLMESLKTSSNIPTSQLDEQIAQVKAGSPMIELLAINAYFGNSTAEPNTAYMSLAACNQKSFSRGSIHIASTDSKTYPTINPNYLQAPVDKFYLVKSAQYLRKLAQTSALAKYIDAETEPGPSVQTEAEWEEWVEGVVRTEFHPIGTCSMNPRSAQGVVDPELVVYGTSNLRVVDASIMPLHVSTHVDAIAEKAADMIKQAAAVHR